MLTNTGKQALIDAITSGSPVEDFKFHLCDNTFVVDETTVLTDFHEVGWPVYAPIHVLASAYLAAAMDSSFNFYKLTGSPLVFTNGGSTIGIAAGFFVTGQTSGILYGGAMFAIPIAVLAGASQGFLGELIVNTLP